MRLTYVCPLRYKADPCLNVKEQLVSPEPDVEVILRLLWRKKMSFIYLLRTKYFFNCRNPLKDNFVLLACDGIFDVMNNHDVADFVLSVLSDNPVDICTQLIDSCLDKVITQHISKYQQIIRLNIISGKS